MGAPRPAIIALTISPIRSQAATADSNVDTSLTDPAAIDNITTAMEAVPGAGTVTVTVETIAPPPPPPPPPSPPPPSPPPSLRPSLRPPPPSPPSSSDGDDGGDDGDDGGSSNVPVGAVVGGTVGGVAFLIIICIMCYCCNRETDAQMPPNRYAGAYAGGSSKRNESMLTV